LKASLSSSEREKRVRFEHDRIPGGAIRKARPKEVLRDEKVMQALAASMRGGAIRNTRKKEAKRDKKIDQALAAKRGGRIKFHDKSHEYLYKKLSGRGGALGFPTMPQNDVPHHGPIRPFTFSELPCWESERHAALRARPSNQNA